MNQTFDVTKTIKIEDIYPKGYTIPKGYEAVAFRLVQPGEYWLCAFTGELVNKPVQNVVEPDFIRIILRPIPKRKVFTFRETGPARIILNGEWYHFSNSGAFFYKNSCLWEMSAIPVSLVETEE